MILSNLEYLGTPQTAQKLILGVVHYMNVTWRFKCPMSKTRSPENPNPHPKHAKPTLREKKKSKFSEISGDGGGGL